MDSIRPISREMSCFPLVSSQIPLDKNLAFLDRIDEEVDVYTQLTFKDLKDQSFNQGMQYFIAILHEGDKTYLFDASMFMVNYIQQRENFRNPLTKHLIEDFSIYVFSKEAEGIMNIQLFKKKNDFDEISNHLPIFWNSIQFSERDRIAFLIKYAKKQTDSSEAIKAYEKAVQLGSKNAKIYLYQHYKNLGQNELAAFWIEKAVQEDEVPKLSKVFACAELFDLIGKQAKSLQYYILAAKQNNYLAIMLVIDRIEKGQGIETDQEEADKWRALLPDKWKTSSMADFYKHLKEIHYDYNRVGYP